MTHHICIGYVPHNPEYKYGVAYWTDKERDEDGSALPDKGPTFLGPGAARSSDGDPTPIPAGRVGVVSLHHRAPRTAICRETSPRITGRSTRPS